jgi:hypothetical protein
MHIKSLAICIALSLLPLSSQAITLTKGEQYGVCRDLLPYLQDIEANGEKGLASRPIFTPDGKVFKAPKWQEIEKYDGLKVNMQRVSLRYKSFKEWRKILDWEEGIVNDPKAHYRVEVSNFDLNNNGLKEKILRSSYYSGEAVGWFYSQNVVTNNNNLDISFYYTDGYFSDVTGEVFFYKGRTFSISLSKYKNSVNEFFDSPYGDSGIVVKKMLCVFK